jgi:hypothetical protein
MTDTPEIPPQIRREDLISRRAAAHLLNIHANTLDRAARDAGLKKYRMRGDNKVYYLRSEIEQISIVEEIVP